jgi:hypothetical protein
MEACAGCGDWLFPSSRDRETKFRTQEKGDITDIWLADT